MHGKWLAIMMLVWSSSAAYAFEVLEEITWPESGRFPAYPAEPRSRNVEFSVFGGAMRDSNVFRLSDTVNPLTTLGTTQKSDTITRAGVGVRGDIPISRQRLRFEAQAEHRDFDHFGVLDHNPYKLGAAWNWAADPQWSGEIGAGRRSYLASLAELQTPLKDMITEDRAFASAGYRFTPRWRVRGGVDNAIWQHGDFTRRPLDNRTTAGTVGVDYMTPADNSIGGQVKYSEGHFTNLQVVGGTLVDNDFKEWETSLVAHWIVTGKSILDARLGYTSRSHDNVPQRDFDGATGRLSYDWIAGAKTILNFALWREIRSIEDVSASYVESTGWGVGPSWAPTSKIVLQAKYIQEDRDYKGEPTIALTGSVPREDTFRGVSLMAGYVPRRNIELSVALQRGDRNSNTVGRDYDYTAVMGNARLKF